MPRSVQSPEDLTYLHEDTLFTSIPAHRNYRNTNRLLTIQTETISMCHNTVQRSSMLDIGLLEDVTDGRVWRQNTSQVTPKHI